MYILHNDQEEKEKGTYAVVFGKKQNGERFTSAWVKCPECGNVATLTDHTIAFNGVVSPSLVCPYDGCSFHEYVGLDAWENTSKRD